MNRLPIIRNPSNSWCCPPAAGIKQLHDVCRTLTRPILDTASEDVLQDEDGFAVLDEQTGTQIYDTLKNGGTFNG